MNQGTHYLYGWARLSVAPDTLIVESYGINLVTDSSIIPEKGDTIQSPFIASQALAFCLPGDSVELQLKNPVQSEHLQWYVNSHSLPVGTNSSIVVKYPGYYSLTKTFDGLTFSLSNSLSIVSDIYSVRLYFSNLGVLFTQPTSKYPPFTYQWFLNGNVLPFKGQYIYPTQTGTYQVVVTDAKGCSVASNTFYYVFTGITSPQNDLVKLYSANRKLFVQLPDLSFENGSLAILNTLGQTVLQQAISSENFTANLEPLEPGIYFVRLEKNGKQIVRKIAVQ